jgi:hypothetical protein
MPSNPCQSAPQQNLVPPAPTTIFQRLPQSCHVPLAHLVATLIRRVHAARQSKEGHHER